MLTRIYVTRQAWEAVAAFLPGPLGKPAEVSNLGNAALWLPPHVIDGLRALRGPGESYSDVILKLSAKE